VVAGIRPAEWLSQQCGVIEADDPKALDEFIDKKRQSMETDNNNNNPFDKNQQTKLTDQQGSSNTTA